MYLSVYLSVHLTISLSIYLFLFHISYFIFPNIPHKEGLASLIRFLDAGEEKKVTAETLVQLAEIVLKNNMFQFNEKIVTR